MLISDAGRTGRIGNVGLATSFYNERDADLSEALVKTMLETHQVIPDFLESFIPEGFTSQGEGDVNLLKFEADSDFGDAEESTEAASGGWGAPAADAGSGWGAPAAPVEQPAAGGWIEAAAPISQAPAAPTWSAQPGNHQPAPVKPVPAPVNSWGAPPVNAAPAVPQKQTWGAHAPATAPTSAAPGEAW